MTGGRFTSFRGDIEGLRAVAVLPILAFHLQPSWCPGGFIGVDIFFVISGFLITGLIVKQGDDFSFKKFYLRRFFRLFPALLTTLQLSLILGWLIMSPSDFAQLGMSSLSAMFGVSNFYFYSTLDYFNGANIYHPLLHTWSLGVEEQFYLLWPLLLVFAMRRRTNLILLLVGASVLSFLSIGAVQKIDADFAFYMMPLRIFEFAAGAALVLLQHSWVQRTNAAVNGIAGAFGAGLLAYAFLFFDETLAWPGPYALVPVLATALLILSARTGLWQAVLSNLPMRYIGRISYSLYLIHWPVIVFYRYYVVVPPGPLELITLGAASIGIAACLYLLVEKPFRRSAQPEASIAVYSDDEMQSAPAMQTRAMSAAASKLNLLWRQMRGPVLPVSTLIFLAGAGFVIVKKGVPSRIEGGRAQSADNVLSFAGDMCSAKRSRCVFGDRSARRVVYVMGDSHALNLIYGLDQLFRRQKIKGIAFYDHGCLFLEGTTRFTRGRPDRTCTKRVQAAYDFLKTTSAPVIFAGSYATYRNSIGLKDADSAIQMDQTAYYTWLGDQLKQSMGRLGVKARRIVVIKQAYSTGIDLPKCLNSPSNARSAERQRKNCKTLTRREVMARYWQADRLIDKLVQAFPNLQSIDPKATFCPSEICKTRGGAKNSELFFRDHAHLTNAGSVFLIEQIKDELMLALRAK